MVAGAAWPHIYIHIDRRWTHLLSGVSDLGRPPSAGGSILEMAIRAALAEHVAVRASLFITICDSMRSIDLKWFTVSRWLVDCAVRRVRDVILLMMVRLWLALKQVVCIYYIYARIVRIVFLWLSIVYIRDWQSTALKWYYCLKRKRTLGARSERDRCFWHWNKIQK